MIDSPVMAIDWAHRWQGGFCPLGVGGRPIRGERLATPSLGDRLWLPEAAPGPMIDYASALSRWQAVLPELAVVVAPSLAAARQAVLEACAITAEHQVALAVNVTSDLIETIKTRTRRLVWADIDPDLTLTGSEAAHLIWAQTQLGLAPALGAPGPIRVLEAADTIPSCGLPPQVEVMICGLFLDRDPDRSGALIAFTSGAHARRAAEALAHSTRLDPARMSRQFDRLALLKDQQLRVLADAHQALTLASGLDVRPINGVCPLQHALAVRIPAEVDAATFHILARAENTPCVWPLEHRPLAFQAVSQRGSDGARRALRSAEALSRWLLVPIGPDATQGVIEQSVLGVVKTAEYLGVRYITQPDRAQAYAAWLTEMYGPDHDAYRPIFL